MSSLRPLGRKVIKEPRIKQSKMIAQAMESAFFGKGDADFFAATQQLLYSNWPDAPSQAPGGTLRNEAI